MDIPLSRQQLLKAQNVSTYHYKTAQRISNTTSFMQLKYPNTHQPNDVTSFDMTDVSHRIRTYNANWNRILFDKHDFADEGFFSLSNTSLDVQCFSCGLILTRFPSNVSIFVIHFIMSPDCQHLYAQDPINKPILRQSSQDLHSLPTDSDIATHVKAAGFIHIKTLHNDYYKCPSCHGTIHKWQATDDPWKIHAKTFPFCPHIIKTKTKYFVKSVFKLNLHHQPQTTMYYRFLQTQIRALNFDLMILETQQMLTSKSTCEILSFLQIQHDRFMRILQYYSDKKTDPSSILQDDRIHALQKQIDCIICMDKPRNAVILPCTHYIACKSCIEKSGETCPLCRNFISSIITVLPS